MPAPWSTPCIHAAQGGPGAEDRIGVEMIPEAASPGFEGGRALLTRREAAALRDALCACLGDPSHQAAPPLNAEQIVDLVAEAVVLIGEAFGRPAPHAAHLDHPAFRLARAVGVAAKPLRVEIANAAGPVPRAEDLSDLARSSAVGLSGGRSR